MAFNYRKTTQALNFFAMQEGEPIVTMKALKLIWLADRLHLRRYGRTITDDTYYAMRHGPVASTAHNIASHNEQYLSREVVEYSEMFVTQQTSRSFSSAAPVDEKIFSQTDRDALRDVYAEFGALNERELSLLSHDYPEWSAFEESLNKHPKTRHEMRFDDFFRNAEKNSKLFTQDAEVLALSQEMYQQPW